ncbi:MAG TPA: hypothetical protein VN969_23730 [Streptosporangiaceae bacterium]|nr:hypothetical protein [Streptosporangiaceae bacterium]
MDPLLLSSIDTIEAFTTVKRLWESPRRQLRKTLRDAIGTAPDDVATAFRSLIAEGDLNAFDARRSSRWWGRAYYLLGLPAAVLAAVAGATGLISAAGRVPAAIIALVAAGLTAAATFLNSGDNQKNRIVMSAAWSELADDARLQHLSYVQAIKKLDDPADSIVLADEYWARVLNLHKRKGRLLRGDPTASGETS